jgi:hypothetical protein
VRRHVIIGRFGPDDKLTIPAATDEVVTHLQLVASNKRLDHGIDRALEDLAELDVYPTEIGLDILILAAHVHAADTRISRVTESQDSWTREMRLVVPVSDLSRWSASAILLERMLNFLTGDRWKIGFRARPPRFVSAVKAKPLISPKPAFDQLSLFSGGLDSLIGSIDLLEAGSAPLLVSHAGEGATSDAQNTLFDALKKHYKDSRFNRLRLWMTYAKDLVKDGGVEETTRGRSFLFIAAGLFAGTGLRVPFTLSVPENGVIALNVPLDLLRLGSLSTRTTHPFYMARWNELLGILEVPAQVENPYWDKRKGEIAAQCANLLLLKGLVADSLSCSSPTKGRWQGHGVEHCGYCLPCLIRRAAVRAGLDKDPTTYTVSDLTGRVLDTRKAEGQQVRSFHLAISRLQRQPDLAPLLIYKSGPLGDLTPAQKMALAGVYQRGLSEVAALLKNVQTEPS